MPSNILSTSIPSAPRANPITSNVVAAGGHSQGVDDICCHIDLNCRGGANSRFLQSWKCLGFIAVVVFLVLVVFVLLPFKVRSRSFLGLAKYNVKSRIHSTSVAYLSYQFPDSPTEMYLTKEWVHSTLANALEPGVMVRASPPFLLRRCVEHRQGWAPKPSIEHALRKSKALNTKACADNRNHKYADSKTMRPRHHKRSEQQQRSNNEREQERRRRCAPQSQVTCKSGSASR
ncbi:hypothetical protein BDN71DRAFT_1499203 [Pleurotus eryngii]|uniref:Uncharacterized protein n=1 Tax=Pleurotus eryngii TaxID=5323 RepID=A0A9P5ZMS2_PLEER|nr:hypothetical protein BDN71DRAFT_1499203 [Pleurotus eryngii]